MGVPHCQLALMLAPESDLLQRCYSKLQDVYRVRPSIALQTLASATQPLCGRKLATPLVSTTEPPGRRYGAAYLTAAMAPKTRTSKT